MKTLIAITAITLAGASAGAFAAQTTMGPCVDEQQRSSASLNVQQGAGLDSELYSEGHFPVISQQSGTRTPATSPEVGLDDELYREGRWPVIREGRSDSPVITNTGAGLDNRLYSEGHWPVIGSGSRVVCERQIGTQDEMPG